MAPESERANVFKWVAPESERMKVNRKKTPPHLRHVACKRSMIFTRGKARSAERFRSCQTRLIPMNRL
jgi:hypothetical protein